MYGLNEIMVMNLPDGICHKQRVSSDTISFFNGFNGVRWAEFAMRLGTNEPITHGEWEARQQKELEVHI